MKKKQSWQDFLLREGYAKSYIKAAERQLKKEAARKKNKEEAQKFEKRNPFLVD